MKQLESLLSVLAAAALLAACSSTPVGPDPAAAKPAAATATASPSPAATRTAPAPASTVATVTLPPHKDPKSALSTERSVYFDYDDFSVNGRYIAVVERHGSYLQRQAPLVIRIEGHADERGSAEYNLSLGQKRAEAVLRALKIAGARESQMEAVSYGEERPRASGHGETAWSENRRADIAYRP
jgi:peptidoglycan-associated lipoprotein